VTNLNDAKITDNNRVKIFSYAGTATNNPANIGGVVLVIGTNQNFFTQLAFSNTSPNNIYARAHTTAGFSAWRSV